MFFIPILQDTCIIESDKAGIAKITYFRNQVPKVTKNMESIIGHRIDYNVVGTLRGQRHIPGKN